MISEVQKNVLLLGNLLVGASSTIFIKEQSNCSITIDGKTQQFNHPFMQCFAMYIGEAICLIIFLVHKSMNKKQLEMDRLKAIEQGKIPNINPFLLIIPTTCDFITSCLAFFALELMPASVYSMIRGGNVIVTAAFSIFFLKAKLYRQHYLGLGFILTGLVVVGIQSVLSESGNNDDEEEQDNTSGKTILGIFLLISSFFTYSTQVILEQKYFSKYSLNPFQVVGIEGCWGILISCATIFGIFDFIPCPSSLDCPEDLHGNKYLENGPLFFQQIFSFKNQPDQPTLFIMVILGIITILFFNALQMSVTKFISSLARNIISVTTPFLVWILSLIIGWEKFSILQLLGFCILSTGTVIYNEILVIPYAGFNKNLKINSVKKEQDLTSDSTQKLIQDETEETETQ